MNDLCIIRELDSDLTEDECVPILPLSCISSHQIKNPLVNNNSSMSYTYESERRIITSKILSKPQSFTAPYMKLESKNNIIKEESTTKTSLEVNELKEEAMKDLDVEENITNKNEPKLYLKVDPYQIKLTPELKNNFKRLIKFKPIALEEVLKHKGNLDPQPIKKKTLILDIDGTLVCSSLTKPSVNHIRDKRHKLKQIISINVRPYAIELIKTLHPFYEIVIFTFGTSSYANLIADYLDPENSYIEYIFHRAHCIVSENLVIKDLRVLGGRELKDLIIIDNSVESFAGNIDNGIYIPTYEKNLNDIELKRVMEFLLKIVNVDDSRPYVKSFAGICDLFEVYKQSII